MSLRQLEVFLPQENAHEIEKVLEDQSIRGIWQVHLWADRSIVKILMSSQEAEAAIDRIQRRFSDLEGFKIVVMAVEAIIPRPELPAETPPDLTEIKPDVELDPQRSRINRHELYEDVNRAVGLTANHLLMVLLSTIIAAIGLLRNEETIIIGAMVIAPLLGPNMALSLATTLADMSLAKKALKVGSIGISLALGFSICVGFFIPVSLQIPQIASRTSVHVSDVILALASGIAGAFSFTSGITNAIVGVMVSVALLPPVVTFGMLLGSGQWEAAVGSLLLVLTNLICLNLAGVLTFSVQNIRPSNWWEVPKAQKTTNAAYFIWFGLLSALVVSILWWKNFHMA